MSKYVRNVVHKTTFGGDAITVTMKAMRFTDLMLLQSKAKDGETAMLAAFMDMLDQYVIGIEGATDADGAPIKVSDLNSAYWAGLVGELVVALLNAATITDPT